MYKYKYYRGTAEKLKEVNPILKFGEIGYETDTKWFKYGDDTTPYNDLPYVNKPKTSYDIAVERGFTGGEEAWKFWCEVQYNLAVEQGFTGTIYDWKLYLEPSSAYYEAVRLGFVGTPDQYYHNTIIGVSENSWGTF